MTPFQTSSLGEQISRKMSVWVLVLITTITIGMFGVSYFLSRQIFNQQVNTWISIAPQDALTNLIDSDHFSIRREVSLIESAHLFSSFTIYDNQQRAIAAFGKFEKAELIPIYDEAKVIWGYYSFATNFLKFFSPFLITSGVFLILVLMFYLIIRSKIKNDLENEFVQFNSFLNEIERVTKKISALDEEDNFSVYAEVSKTTEQEIINRTILRLVDEIKKSNKKLREAILETEQKRFQEELTRTALQVAHDIGSPLAVLETIVQSSMLTMPEENRISVRNAASRIRDISASILLKVKKSLPVSSESFKQYELFGLLMQIISEKRLQYHSKAKIEFNFDTSFYGSFAMLKPSDFGRVMSNLINNSVEAIKYNGVITVTLSKMNKNCVIEIKDNGKGISPEVLKKIGEHGQSFGKAGGSGLGLYHAKTIIENWGGRLEIESVVGKGTCVVISLPIAQTPSWYISEILLLPNQQICIIDDDQSIHEVWQNRLDKIALISGIPVMTKHFYSPIEFVQWKESQESFVNNDLYLCDYEFLGLNINGIDLINKLKINYVSILVTSRFDSDELMLNCEAMGMKLLSKDMANFIPIKVFSA